MYTLG